MVTMEFGQTLNPVSTVAEEHSNQSNLRSVYDRNPAVSEGTDRSSLIHCYKLVMKSD